MQKNSDCVFCQIVAGETPAEIIWENEKLVSFVNKYPNAPVHLLVIPKEHVSKEAIAQRPIPLFWEEMMEAVFEVVRLKGLDKTGYKLVNNGAGYNHFDHEHIHVMGGLKKEPQD